MPATPLDFSLALPIADRRRAMEFYRETFGFAPEGEPAEDGVPEPLQFRLGEQTLLVLVPTDGFGWVLGDRPVAPAEVSECLLGLSLDSEAAVDELVDRIRRGGGTVIVEPAREEWGYTAVCADPDGHAWQLLAEPQSD